MPAPQKTPAASRALSPETLEMQPVLAELLPQMLNKGYSTKLTELPAYQAVRARDAAYQGRLVLALGEAMSPDRQEEPCRNRWALGELMTALLRTRQELTQADYLRLFASAGFSLAAPGARAFHFFPFPAVMVLSQLAKLAKPQALAPATRTFLEGLREVVVRHQLVAVERVAGHVIPPHQRQAGKEQRGGAPLGRAQGPPRSQQRRCRAPLAP